ncbi:MAG: hypothetical protein A4E65_01349 [Syntrophorhabdus sp. PtaU1.Bin153]|nr:MAG: hypothetical protein A4E65_01349 [Syntrophorhabdus sp. PtaU1.Bin153]
MLFEFIPAEDYDLPRFVVFKQITCEFLTERTCSTRDKNDFVIKHTLLLSSTHNAYQFFQNQKSRPIAAKICLTCPGLRQPSVMVAIRISLGVMQRLCQLMLTPRRYGSLPWITVLRLQLLNSDQERHSFVRLVPFQTTVKLVSLK